MELTRERVDKNTLRQKGMAAHETQVSFFEHLDGRAMAFMGPLKRRLMEAMSSHTDDMYLSREILTVLPPFFTVIIRRVHLPRNWSPMFVFLGYAIDQSRIDVEEVDPHEIDGFG